MQINAILKVVTVPLIQERKVYLQTLVGLISKNSINHQTKFQNLIMLKLSLTLYLEVCVTPKAAVILKPLISRL